MRAGGVVGRKAVWLLAATVAAVAVLMPAIPAAATSLTVTGRVTNAGGAGIPDVEVLAVDSATYSYHDYGSAETDANGYYTLVLDAGAPSSFKIAFDPWVSNYAYDTDYLGEFYMDSDYVLSAADVSAGGTNVDAVLEVGGTISGKVFAPDGITPLRDIVVDAYSGFGLRPETLTEADGTYVLRGVAPGFFNVAAETDYHNDLYGTSYTDATVKTTVEVGVVSSGVNITVGGTGGSTPTPVTLVPVYRLYNFVNGTHFFTDSAGEKDYVLATWGNVYRLDGVAYSLNPANNTTRLTRLYNRVSGSHFYTASPGEAADALAKWPNVFSMDGPTYAVNPGPVSNSLPVYRFYNLKNGSHFYTASEDEKNSVLANYGNVYRLDGPAFWIGQ